MIVSPSEPFKLVFSLYQHEFLGFLLEPFVVKLTNSGEFSLQSQNISESNVMDFEQGLTPLQVEMVKLTEKTRQETVFKKFNTSKKLKPEEFFKKIFDPQKGDAPVKEAILSYLDNYRSKIFSQISEQILFVMGSDGIPTWKAVSIKQEPAKAYFHFDRQEDKTIYYPIIKCGGEKVKFQFKGGMIINDLPAALLLDDELYLFDEFADGKKIRPFLNKPNIEIPKKIEETYYRKFIVPLVANFNVYAKGFDITYEKEDCTAGLTITEVKQTASKDLFASPNPEVGQDSNFVFELDFKYGSYSFKYDNFSAPSYVFLEKTDESWRFHKVRKNLSYEKNAVLFLQDKGLNIRNGRTLLPKIEALEWLSTNKSSLDSYPVDLVQNKDNSVSYFLGYSNVQLDIEEKRDWFDINAIVVFGEFKIPFIRFRSYILGNKKEFVLPNGQVAVIPDAWFSKYSELFENVELDLEEVPRLRKQFVGLVSSLQTEGIATTMMSRKLASLQDFKEIGEYELPQHFEGELRAYQKAGYDWLNFLKDFRFGGCLADDMGLGKTVTTLAFLQKIKEDGAGMPSLLVLPTSLIYNWRNEAQKFTPELRVMIHFGINRSKTADAFRFYDLVICSYGVLRMDIDFIKHFKFNYAVLDESQSIKNPTSGVYKAAMELNTQNRLILTGTPLENSTLDLWSQMSFVNPGLLGSLGSFKKKYKTLIEKRKDEDATSMLFVKIKPFMLRRNKRQVAQDLPEKIESVVYCQMTEEQEKIYEETKSYLRNQIMEMLEKGTLKRSSILVLQGLSKLRQLANNPALLDPNYSGGSGKDEDVMDMIREVAKDGSKTLVFSQFVKHLTHIGGLLEKEGIPYLYLDGGTTNRMALVDRFQKSDKETVFLISLKAGGVGLNLTAAENVLILDPWWNPAIEAQAIDRAHRIGQTKTVFSYKYITQNTIEEKILELQNQKKQLFEQIIVEEEGFFKSLATDDILSILE